MFKKGSKGTLLLAAIIMVVLNSIIFLGVYSNNPQTFQTILDSLYVSIGIYLFFLAICIVAILFGKRKIIKFSFYALLGIMTGHVFINLGSLIISSNTNQNGSAILFDAFLIWVSSIMIFSIWYWILDKVENEGGGRDFLFPQNQTALKLEDSWKPQYFDYLSLSFFTSTSFAPADTLPFTKRGRLLMMCEALISLVIIGMIASRAISLIK